MTDSVIFYLLKEEPEVLQKWLDERHTTNRVLDAARSGLSKETLAMYAPSGINGPTLQLGSNIGEGVDVWYHNYPFNPEYYLDWNDVKAGFRTEHKEVKREGIAFTCSHAVKGKVGAQLHKHRKVTIATYGETELEFYGRVSQVYFFDEALPKKKFVKTHTLDISFNVYQFICTDGRQVRILTEEELPTNEIIIEGNLVQLEDASQIGETRKLSMKLPLMIACRVHTGLKTVTNISEAENLIERNGLRGEHWFEYVFSVKKQSFTNADYFSWLVSAALLSCKKSGYPLHVLVVGPTGTGKTTLIECLQSKIEPERAIVDGGASTIKTLIPSFKNNLPEPGAVLQSVRLVCIDEFFRLMSRGNPDQKNELLASLNTLLEHKERTFGSGNGNITGKMTSRMFAAANPPENVDNFSQLAQRIDNSFLSRFLVWWQNFDEIKNARESKGCNVKGWTPTILRELCDYFNTIEVRYDELAIKTVYDAFKVCMRDDRIKDIYTSRYGRHHIHCLIDGIVKTRWIMKGGLLEATKEDYAVLVRVWKHMIQGWKLESDAQGFSMFETLPEVTI